MPDGARVIAWYGKARPGTADVALLPRQWREPGRSRRAHPPVHGRGLGRLHDDLPWLRRQHGRPTEVNNVADARLAYGALVQEGVAPQSIIAYGESLGTNIAVRVAAERPVGGLILDAPYTSIVDVAAGAYPFLPVRYFLTDRYETSRYIASVKVPLLILHGERDPVIPVAMGKELYRLANDPRRLVLFPNGHHSDLYIDGNNAIEAVRKWVSELKG